jgi:MFS family permease
MRLPDAPRGTRRPAGSAPGDALSMLDNFIVSTSLPRIVGELGGVAHLSWVVTAYVLGTTVSTPIWGRSATCSGLIVSVVMVMNSCHCGWTL